jgi:flagellar motor switch protein FliG
MAEEQLTAPAGPAEITPELALELESLRPTERAALLMLLLGEQQASDIVAYLNPREVQLVRERRSACVGAWESFSGGNSF